METLSYFPPIPTAVLFFNVLIDMVYIFRHGKRVPFDFGAVVFIGFILCIALFMSFGAGQCIALLKKEGFSDTFSDIFGGVMLFIGYQITKHIDQRDARKMRDLENRETYLRIVKHIGYPAGAVIFLIVSMFVFMIFLDNQMGGVRW